MTFQLQLTLYCHQNNTEIPQLIVESNVSLLMKEKTYMKKLFYILALLISSALSAQTLRVGTYNIRYKNSQDQKEGNGWEKRCPQIVRQIDSLGWDVFGAQEVLYEQLKDMKKALSNYDCKGVGREDGREKGEFAPVFFNKERFECISSGTFWLSETDSVVSTGWDAALPRICTWVKLREKSAQKVFWFYNCHLDHRGVAARVESVKLILRKIQSDTNNELVILSGDFNAGPESAACRFVAQSGLLKDCFYESTVSSENENTFNDFKELPTVHQRIDHVFVSRFIAVKEYGIIRKKYKDNEGIARFPSDHFPVGVVLDLSTK